jgi:arylsulfatase A-like enzyme
VGIVVATLLTGCDGVRSQPLAVVDRWIEDDPDGPLNLAGLVAAEPVLELAPDGAWQPEPGTSATRSGGRLELDLERRWGGVTQAVDLDAADVSVVEVSVDGARGVMLDWAREDEPLSRERRVEIWLPPHRPTRTEPVRVPVAGHRFWSGRIRVLRVGVVRPPEGRGVVVLRGVRALSERIRPEAIADAVGRAWKVDLGGDVRNAVAALPGRPMARLLEVPAGAELRLGYAVEPRQAAAVTFVVDAEREDGTRAELLRATASGGDDPRWRDARVDLSRFQGERVRLVLDTATDEPLDPASGLPMWSSPEVVAPAEQRRPNVVVISIDTLRADRMSMYGYHRATTPELDAWAARSAVVFERAVVQAPWTLPSHVSLFTGLEPFHHGVNFRRPAPPRLEMLAEYLRREGYATAAVTGGGFVHPSFGFWQGFDSYRYWSSRLDSGRELDSGVEQAIAWIDANGDRPFFLFFHTFEVHGPYRARQPYFDQLDRKGPAAPDGVIRVMDGPVSAADGFVRAPGYFTLESPEGATSRRRLGVDDLAMVSRAYDSQVAYTDRRIAALLGRIAQAGPATVVLTSDHGETIGERGDAGHGPLDDANLMVPLAVAFADGRGSGRRIPVQVRSIDILPTLLESLGIEPRGEIDGQSLVPLVDGRVEPAHRPAWSYNPTMNLGIALRLDDQFKYHFNDTAWAPVGGAESLFDLDADPFEETPLDHAWDGLADARRRTGALLGDAVGWRLRLINGSPAELMLRLASGAIQPAKVKILPGAQGSIRWRGSGAAEVTVDAGGELTIALLEAALGVVSISAPPNGGNRVELAEPAAGEVVRRTLTTVGWIDDAGGGAEVLMVAELWAVGDPSDSPAEPDGDDPELRQRLEALGYVQ